jgi:Ferric reductase like transmembrane component
VTLASVGPSAYWYLTRGTGLVALVLLTVSVVLGIIGSMRISAPRWPRFAIDVVHRDVSLLVIVVLLIHIGTTVLDSFAPVSLTASVVPFISSYRPFWLGLGALSFDLVLALAITSLLRRRLGYQSWRAVHWLAYVSWPVAVLHGLGTGTDTKVWWMLLVTALCVGAVAFAACMRIARAESQRPGLRTPGIALCLAAPIALLAFTVLGPLEKGWAKRSGTPQSLLAHDSVSVAAAPAPPTRSLHHSSRPFSAALAGSVRQAQIPSGAIIDLRMRLSGGAHGRLRVRLGGAPIPGGGLSLTGSQVDLIADGIPSVLQGKISSLAGTEFVAHVTGTSGAALTLHVHLHLDQATSSVTGAMTAVPG